MNRTLVKPDCSIACLTASRAVMFCMALEAEPWFCMLLEPDPWLCEPLCWARTGVPASATAAKTGMRMRFMNVLPSQLTCCSE